MVEEEPQIAKKEEKLEIEEIEEEPQKPEEKPPEEPKAPEGGLYETLKTSKTILF